MLALCMSMEVVCAPVRVNKLAILPTSVVAQLARTNPKGMTNLHQRGFVVATCKMTPRKTRGGASFGYSFSAIIAARVAADFARAGGALRDIRGVLMHLAKSTTLIGPVPASYVVITDGSKVIFEGVPTEHACAALMAAFAKTAKWQRVIPLGAIVAEVEADLAKLSHEAAA